MVDHSHGLEEKLKQLRAQYAQNIQIRIGDLSKIIYQLDGNEVKEARTGVYTEIRDVTHKLAGSGATFGFPDVTAVCRTMEHLCIDVIEGRKDDDADAEGELVRLCSELYQAASEQEQLATPVRTSEPELHGSSRIKVLVVMELDEQNASQIKLEMDHFGIDVVLIDHPNALIDAVSNQGPFAAVITGLVFGGDAQAAFTAFKKFRESDVNCHMPIIVHTHLDNMAARLGAVQMGAKAYLVKPVDMADLVTVLEDLTERHDEEPFHVLIIDDDESLALHTEVVLQGAGMNTQVVTEPSTLFDVMDDFSPELILLDLYMPECSGQEVAAIIRQREDYAGIPIVFLSGESDKEKQLSAMELGGDDFLTKPIRASHLVSSVSIRAARFRKLRAFMVRDSMTGLFNHTTTKQFLDNELSRAKRLQKPVSLVSLDIDHFKNVNDTYGHAVGDRVIKALSRLLRQRLRAADVIGRMGGEEFAAILSDTDTNEAETVFNQIREAFGDIVFRAGEKTFSATISCGIATYPRHNTATSLSDAADKALYAAKHSGRNCVVKADEQ